VDLPRDKDTLLAFVKILACLKGADLCDRCGDAIWPDLELVRCDCCIGKYGPPKDAAIMKAHARHRVDRQKSVREASEDWIEEME
jgi:hypothetical protein